MTVYTCRNPSDISKLLVMSEDFSDICTIMPSESVHASYFMKRVYLKYVFDDVFTKINNSLDMYHGDLFICDSLVFKGVDFKPNSIDIFGFQGYWIVYCQQDFFVYGIVLVRMKDLKVCGSMSSIFEALPSGELARIMLILRKVGVL